MTAKPAKRSAGARKAWRTRKRMKAARDEHLLPWGYMEIPTKEEMVQDIAEHQLWPRYMKRALPNPWLQ